MTSRIRKTLGEPTNPIEQALLESLEKIEHHPMVRRVFDGILDEVHGKLEGKSRDELIQIVLKQTLVMCALCNKLEQNSPQYSGWLRDSLSMAASH